MLVLACLLLGVAPATRAQPAETRFPTRSTSGLSSVQGAASGRACTGDDQLELIDIDTLFYIDNRGLSRVFVDLNGHPFKLVTDTSEWHHSDNAFLIPQHGEITISIGAYIVPGGENCMAVKSQGPAGSDADLVVGDLLLPGQQVAYAITGLDPLPEQFGLLTNHPNPFRDRTTLTYEIPEARTNGLPVRLVVYDAAGRRVRALVEAHQFPGRFTAMWDGTDDAGYRLAAALYFCRLEAGSYSATRTVVLVE